VTVCIAAACEEQTDDPKIVWCTDVLISGALGSAETMLKTRAISDKWRCLTAGKDSEILATLQLLKVHFGSKQIDETNILACTRAALNQRKREKANELTHGKFALSYDDFLMHGKTRLPNDLFRGTAMEIELIQIEAQFIIIGYTEIGGATIVQTDKRCSASLKEDFATVGEGAYLAQASLLSRGHSYTNSFGKTLYNVYEAKKFSQGARSVGEITALSVFHKSGIFEFLLPNGVEFLDKKYQQSSRQWVSDFEPPDGIFQQMYPIQTDKSNVRTA